MSSKQGTLHISLYGGSNETYEKMCGIPAYEDVLSNIVKLKEKGVSVSINLSITPYNCHDLDKIYEIVEKHGINVRASSYMYPPVRLDKELEGYGNRLSPLESAKCSVQWDRLRFSEEEFLMRAEVMKNLVCVEPEECFVDQEKVEGGVRCRAGSSSFWMTWDGEMRLCGMMPGPTAYPLRDGFDKAWDEIRESCGKIRQPAKALGSK